ncbi:hypothetical protein NL676_009973 [Syzygium grande]|nr:hypothetical protein NL676_009973 [Syzygium grande]
MALISSDMPPPIQGLSEKDCIEFVPPPHGAQRGLCNLPMSPDLDSERNSGFPRTDWKSTRMRGENMKRANDL